MNITIAKNDLHRGIRIAQRAVPKKSTMPILTCLLIEAESDSVVFTGSSIDISIRTVPILAQVASLGSVALDAKLIEGIVNVLPDGDINIIVDDNYATAISCGKSDFQISGVDPTDFPVLQDRDRVAGFSLPSGTLKQMIAQTIHASSIDPSKPELNSIQMSIEDGQIDFVAIDMFRMSRRTELTTEPSIAEPILVPSRALYEVFHLIDGPLDDEDAISITENDVTFELNTCTVETRRLHGKFPHYKGLLDAEFNTIATVNRQTLLSAINRICAIAEETGKRVATKLDIKANIISISANTAIGSAYDEVPARVNGNDLVIKFNPRYLMDALRVIDDDEIALHMNTPKQPSVIRGIEGGNYEHLIVPLLPDK